MESGEYSLIQTDIVPARAAAAKEQLREKMRLERQAAQKGEVTATKRKPRLSVAVDFVKQALSKTFL